MSHCDLVFVDFETTGLNPFVDEIIEIAVARTSHSVLMGNDIDRVKIFSVKVMPDHPHLAFLKSDVPGSISAAMLNGFDIEQWNVLGAVNFRQSIDKIRMYLKGAKWVGANAMFDYLFFRSMCHRNEIDDIKLGDHHICDISSFAHILLMAGRVSNIKLDTLAAHYGISRSGKIHTASDDVRVLMNVYHGLHTELTLQG